MPNEPLPDDIRRVWQDQPVENKPMPIEEIRRKAQQFEKQIAQRNRGEYLGAAVGIAAFTGYLFVFPSPVARTGSAMVIAGLLLILAQIRRRAVPATLPAELASTASLEFHRGELARQRGLLNSAWLWYCMPLLPGLVVFTAGILPHRTGLILASAGLYLVFFGWIGWLNRRAAGRLDGRIVELESWRTE